MLAIIVNFECVSVLNCNYHIWFFFCLQYVFRYYRDLKNNGSLYPVIWKILSGNC